MSQRYNLYRRISGIYVVRISVPQRFRRYAGQCEIHTSTGTHDLHEAKQRSALLLAVWYQTLQEYEQLEYRTLSESAPLLVGEGMISLANFALSIELPVAQLIQAVMNRNFPVFWLATGQDGFYVRELDEVERDPSTNGFVLNSALAVGVEGFAEGYLQPFKPKYTLQCLLANGVSEEEAAFRPSGDNRDGCWFFDLPGINITPDTLTINNVHAESLRLDWLAKSTPPAVSIHHSAPLAASATSIENDYVNCKHYNKSLSWLRDAYLKYRRDNKAAETVLKAHRDFFDLMIEVMGDIQLESFDRDFLRAYESKLRTIPANRNLMKMKYGVKTLDEAIVKAAERGDKLMTAESVRKYINGLYGAMKWAVAEGMLLKSPCVDFFPPEDKTEREQDKVDVFEPDELQGIFSLPWFTTGTGERNKHGRFHLYQPYYYWMPLLALFTGARVNELAQLMLDDIKENDGIYFFNFDIDDESDKKLKNANARREIPVHSVLIKLGLIEYVKVLRSVGYDRLFPEITPNTVKGHGKAVSAWFNESILNKRLKLERNRTKSFHSFRHSVSTLLKEKGVSSELRAQLAGHVRGTTETEVRYSKDLKPLYMVEVVERIDFSLPEIAKFNIPDGLDALRDALRRKRD
ncbi:site-specific integrase [Pectobacterium carotovorum subsp. carotovorum]|nr:site-specific integrase [Pectobacterium carotovorum]MCL6363596.1 site-specific integrase [Pectobacterium carotovorum subsp. carotovorum]